VFDDDEDRDSFVERLGRVLSETETHCFAWALMPNHFHLLLKTGTAPIALVMKRLLTGYAMGYNRRHRRNGHLFQNRYKSISGMGFRKTTQIGAGAQSSVLLGDKRIGGPSGMVEPETGDFPGGGQPFGCPGAPDSDSEHV
jgi:hypothetical protein